MSLALKIHILFFKICLFFTLFIFGCIGSSLLHMDFLQLWRVGATLPCSMQASHCSGISHCGAQALGMWASVVVAHGLSSCGSWAPERRLSSCGARAQLLHGMWDLAGPGLEPVSPALAGGCPTTAPPGKSPHTFCLEILLKDIHQKKNIQTKQYSFQHYLY